MDAMIKNEKEDCQQVVLLSDAHLVLQGLEEDTLPHPMECIQGITKEISVPLQWIIMGFQETRKQTG